MNIDMKKIFNQIFKDIAIDLGTSTTLIYVKDKGIVLFEPSTVTIDNKTKKVLEVGEKAKNTIGKTPLNVSVINPVESGIISDFKTVAKMLSLFIKEIEKGEKEGEGTTFTLPTLFLRVLISVPSKTSEAEKKIVYDTIKEIRAWKVYIVPESIAIAVGANLPLEKAKGHFIVDIGAGLTDIAVVSLNGVVSSKSINIAGNQLDQDIIKYIKEKHNLLIGEQTAEKIKIEIGSVLPLLSTKGQKQKKTMLIKGKDLTDRSIDRSTAVKEIVITEDEISKAITPSVMKIIKEIKDELEKVPSELVSDIMNSAIYLAGGGSLLRGLDQLIAKETKISTQVLEDPKTTLIRGMGIIMESPEKLKKLTERYK